MIGKFLHDNYKQALSIIAEYGPQVDAYCKNNNVTDADFENWHREELEYLKNLTSKTPENPDAVEYVTTLRDLEDARVRYERCSTIEFRVYSEADFSTGGLSTVETRNERAREADRAKHHANLLKAMNSVDEIEHRLQITRRWQPAEPQYQNAVKFIDHKGFIAVVDELEGRIVQRLFELAKANLAGTGIRFFIIKPIVFTTLHRIQDAPAYLEINCSQVHRPSYLTR